MSTGLRTWLGLASGITALMTGVGSLEANSNTALIYSTYVGGSSSDGTTAIAADEHGRAYVAGWTASSEDFPGVPPPPGVPYDPPYAPYRYPPTPGDGFILGLTPTGWRFYTAFLGGPKFDACTDITVDSSAVYVAWETPGNDSSRVLVSKFDRNAVGPSLYSTLLPGGRPTVNDIAVDTYGNLYVIGQADTRNSLNPSGRAAFVAKVDALGILRYLVHLDGENYENGFGIDVDGDGNAYATGATSSADFPTRGPSRSYKGLGDIFVAKIDPAGSIVYAVLVGGSGRDEGRAISVTQSGEVQVAAETYSIDAPLTGDALKRTLSGGRDPYLFRLDASGSLVYATYLGGSGDENILGWDFGPAGDLYLVGWGHTADSPLADPDQPGCLDNFIARLDPATGAWTSTCLPGAYLVDLAVDRALHVYVTGWVSSTAAFPVVNAFQPSPGDHYNNDGIIAKIAFNRPPDCSAAFASPAPLWPPDGRLVPVAIRSVTDPDGDPVTLTVAAVHQDEPLTKPGTPDATGIGTPNVSIRADRDGKGDGRVYRLSFTATDPQGASCAGTVTVCVPHDQGQGKTCGDGGQLFNSDGR